MIVQQKGFLMFQDIHPVGFESDGTGVSSDVSAVGGSEDLPTGI